MYVWGMLCDNDSSSSICIKQPEIVPNLKFSNIEIGPAFALAIEHKTKKCFTLDTNYMKVLSLGDNANY
jgi:hypothetical protein